MSLFLVCHGYCCFWLSFELILSQHHLGTMGPNNCLDTILLGISMTGHNISDSRDIRGWLLHSELAIRCQFPTYVETQGYVSSWDWSLWKRIHLYSIQATSGDYISYCWPFFYSSGYINIQWMSFNLYEYLRFMKYYQTLNNTTGL